MSADDHANRLAEAPPVTRAATVEELSVAAPPGRTRDLVDDLASAFGPGEVSEITWSDPVTIELDPRGAPWPPSGWVSRASRVTLSGERGEVALRVLETASGVLYSVVVDYSRPRPSEWLEDWTDRARASDGAGATFVRTPTAHRRGAMTPNPVVAELTALVTAIDPSARSVLEVGGVPLHTAALSGVLDVTRAEDASVRVDLLPILRDVAFGAPVEWALRRAGVEVAE